MKLLSFRNQQQGFTIIELLVATAVFSVILLMASYALLQIGRTYFKGLTSTQTQEVARSIADDLSQAIKYSGSSEPITQITTPLPESRICIENRRYSYRPGYQLVDGTPDPSLRQTKYAFYQDDTTSGCPSQDLSLATQPSGRELLGRNMRVANLKVTKNTTNLYEITVRVISGDDDLLCSPSVSVAAVNDCDNPATSTSLGNNDLRCKNSRAGTQFCAVSELNTFIEKRVR